MLAAEDIHRHFEGMHAVDGVSLEVPRGKITGLIGPNGAGKSTFMAVVAGTRFWRTFSSPRLITAETRCSGR